MSDSTTGRVLPAAVVQEMREWVADCVWGDLDAEDVAELSDAQVVRGVARHYEGGLAGFLRSMGGAA